MEWWAHARQANALDTGNNVALSAKVDPLTGAGTSPVYTSTGARVHGRLATRTEDIGWVRPKRRL